MKFAQVVGAVAATVGAAQAGIISLPIDDGYKAIAAFALGLAAVFTAALVKPPTA